MKNVLYSALLVALLLAMACKKDDQDTVNDQAVSSPDYYPLTTGSYWVYEIYKVDTLGNSTATGQMDSLFIAGDTTIQGEHYALLKGTQYGGANIGLIGAYRVSGDCIVNSEGRTLLSWTDFTNDIDVDTSFYPANTPVYSYKARMQSGLQSIAVPAGSFQSLERVTDFVFHIQMDHPNRTYSKFFSEDVGLVLDEYGYSASWWIRYQRRLVRYHIH